MSGSNICSSDVNSSNISNLCQLDGNISLDSENNFESNVENGFKIPVITSQHRTSAKSRSEARIPVRKTIKRNNIILQAIELPVVINLNPRSIYNKTEDLKILLEQYEGDVMTISESWERDNLPLNELLELENYRVISNVKQREFRGGRPALIINEDKYHIKELCPDPITVPIGVEAVWAIITHKQASPRSKVKYIAVGSIYYRGPKSTKKQELFDHIADTFHYLCSKYGSGIDFIIAGDTNRLNLSPILNLSPELQQVVKVPTRLNPDRILDPIITTLKQFYCEPTTKPPINPNSSKNGKPSDHLVVLWEPLRAAQQIQTRKYRTLETRPIDFSGLQKFSSWIENYNWTSFYKSQGANNKASFLQNLLLEKYYDCFPVKVIRLSCDDKPWFNQELKQLDRRQKREYSKNNKSNHWKELNTKFLKECKKAKEHYYRNIVEDLKESEPRKWHSKLKRMSGQEKVGQHNILVEELIGFSDQEQADKIAEHYASISNSYEEIKTEDFKEYSNPPNCPPIIEPMKVYKVIESMNKKAATVPGDIPMKLIAEFSVELAEPFSHLFNVCLQEGIYPEIYKHEYVTPAPKVLPTEKIKDLRKISGFLNSAKLLDKLIAKYLISDMSPSRDLSQYGNEKQLSIQHYLIKMLHKILTVVDTNSQHEAYAVILSMIDWSQAFDRQDHSLGIKSFITNGVRDSLIPILINYFQKRQMKVKWNGKFSSTQKMNGGGAQGGLPGIIEYLSQTNDCADFLRSDEKYRYIDDLSILEIINLISVGISSYNCKSQIPNDMKVGNTYIHPENIKSQKYLDQLEQWTNDKKMKLNCTKSKYMMFNFSNNYQISTRLKLENTML